MVHPASNTDYYRRFQDGDEDFVLLPPYHYYVNDELSLDTTDTYVENHLEEELPKKKTRKVHKKRRKTREPKDETVVVTEEIEPLQNEKRWFSWVFSKLVPPIPTEDEREPYPWKTANYALRMVFYWIWPILAKGYKRTLVPADLWYLPKDLTVEEQHRIYSEHLERILTKHKEKHESKSLEPWEWPVWAVPLALFYTFKYQYSLLCLCLAVSFCCQALSPLITRQLINFVQEHYFGIVRGYNKGIGYTIGAVILIFINGLLLNHFFHNAMVTGAACKLILTKEVLLKLFRLLARLKHAFSTGRITSLMSTDLARIDLAVGFQPLVLCFPIPVIIAVVLLLHQIGVTSLTGIGLFFVSLVVCVLLTSKLFFTRETVVVYTDQRISLMREVLNNLKVIKFYAWEMAYKASIAKVRAKEMKYLFTIKVLRNFITAYAVTLPTLTSMISFVTMWKTNNVKSPSDVFSSLSLYTILAQAIMLLPLALATGADALIGFKRCTDYLLLLEDVEEDESFDFEKAADYAIEVLHADFAWEHFDNDLDRGSLWLEVKEPATPMVMSNFRTLYERALFELVQALFPGLVDINLKIRPGEFVVITGAIGLGKSSLLMALAGFMKLTNPERGSMHINQELLLCAAPWIQNATLRQNVLFGREYEPHRYRRVLRACCLEDDLQELPAGDNTEIGERGITLSGGQKARVNLARAVYAGAPTLLFDDVLSAVDLRVGKHIITDLFQTFLRSHTRILATHQLSLVLSADKIVFLNGDGLIDVGTHAELLARNEKFTKLIEFSHEAVRREENEEKVCILSTPGTPAALLRYQLRLDNEAIGHTIEEEERSYNAISWNVYKKYIDLGSGVFGWTATPVFLLLVSLATFSQLFTNTWLSFWMEHKFKNLSENYYIGWYVGFAFFTVLFTGLEFIMLAYMNNRLAELLNVRAVEKVLHCPMSFMDTNPLGRVLNRFTKDTDSLDNEIGEQLRLFIFPLATIVGIIILCICYLPWFAIAVPFLGISFVFLSNIYQGSSREVKRLEAVQRSVVYNNFNETLTGMDVIKAYKAEDMFVQKNDYLLNRMNEAYFLLIANQRWLCVHLDMIALAFALVICLLCITGQFNILPSSTGLLLNYVIQIVALLLLTVRAMTQVENEMNAVERLHAYAFNLPQEAAYHKLEFKPPPEWPMAGYIQFNDVSLRYRPTLPLVLKDMSFGVYPGEKVGICGRTGAGKLSIMTALYRLVELELGNITIDGIDISSIGLHDLRSKLLIIPQDPVLFQGSIRKNLDPFHEYSDEVLWDSLRRLGLIDGAQLERVKHTRLENNNQDQLHRFHLDQSVEDEGGNFSLGEKQLIALARSLVRNAKILILDEATSLVDYETDAKIQHTISTEFRHCTILCIAHRLKTILSYDRIMVMDKGALVEKGTPWTLYRQKGQFRQMCDKAQIGADDFGL